MLNELPERVLETPALLLHARRDRPGEVLGSASFDSAGLRPVPAAAELSRLLDELDAFSFTACLYRLDAALVERASERLGRHVAEELELLSHEPGGLRLAYVICHLNRGPLDELTVFVGGDGCRPDLAGFGGAFVRTRDLAYTMLRKAVTVFPDLPALHGGKQGEWLVLDAAGRRFGELSETASVALGTVAIPDGVRFLNACRGESAVRRGLIDSLPKPGTMRPDTGSPDVLSGRYWDQMCEVWYRRGLDLGLFTCVPPHFHGPPSPSSKPTGYGLATTAARLVDEVLGRGTLPTRRFLIEALGGVSHYTIEALIDRHGATPGNIVAFDPDRRACDRAAERFGITTHRATNREFYPALAKLQRFDVWINNGLGDDVTSDHVALLLERGVRVFCGAANNFLRLVDRGESLSRIFEAGAIAWPDEAASGGGYAMAVIEASLRCRNLKANTGEAEEHVLRTITARNQTLVEEAVVKLGSGSRKELGEGLWRGVCGIIDSRVAKALGDPLPDAEIPAAANVRSWGL